MKIQLQICLLSLMTVGLVGLTGCAISFGGSSAPPSDVVGGDPGLVPDAYTYDGVETVGVVGDQYVYLGPGDVWILCEPFRLERFHAWERDNAGWRERAVRNDRFRRSRGFARAEQRPGEARRESAGQTRPQPQYAQQHTAQPKPQGQTKAAVAQKKDKK